MEFIMTKKHSHGANCLLILNLLRIKIQWCSFSLQSSNDPNNLRSVDLNIWVWGNKNDYLRMTKRKFFTESRYFIFIWKGLTRKTLLEDDKGKRMEAIKVFSSAIGYLKDHMLTTCKKQLTDIEQSDIMWVLTVPAIWTDSSKQFMREAAEKVDFVKNSFS